MPIGVPRIIYCWGEELPAQWTDIYNFIFRRRMVFLMQYLDDELCNQICGLLINIHMEDRSKELEKKEIERSGVFKSTSKPTTALSSQERGSSSSLAGAYSSGMGDRTGMKQNASFYNKKNRSMEDLLNADEDLGIDDIDTLEQFTLQKITTEWLNWNAQFFDYSDEPYLFYLAELLSKDFNKAQNSQKLNEKNPLYLLTISQYNKNNKNNKNNQNQEDSALQLNSQTSLSTEEQNTHLHSQLLNMLKNKKESSNNSSSFNNFSSEARFASLASKANSLTSFTNKAKIQMGEVYSPFRTNANFSLAKANNLGFKITTFTQEMFFKEHMIFGENISLKTKKQKLLQMFQQYKNFCRWCVAPNAVRSTAFNYSPQYCTQRVQCSTNLQLWQKQKNKIINLLAILAQKNFSSKLTSTKNFAESSEKILGQRNLRREYNLERNFSSFETSLTQSVQNQSKGKFRRYTNYNKSSLKSFNYLSPLAPSFGSSSSEGYRVGVGVEGAASDTLSPTGVRLSLSSSASEARKASFASNANSQSEFRDYYRKQTERALIEEESKKVFVIINSFGGSVGNGVTVHDALQFIKAGSLTLALGVAASAASLALAGGTIGERYVTEGCHVMIHQPESSLQGQASDIWIDSQEIMKIRLDVAEIYSLSTYRPRHKILRDLDRDFYLTATETIQYGLADEIATNEVMSDIIEMTSKVWDYHDSKQQRLLETRESASSGLDTQTQN